MSGALGKLTRRTLVLGGLVLALLYMQPVPANASSSECGCAPATDAQTGEVYTCCWCDNGSGTCEFVCDDPQGSDGSFPC